LRTMNDTKMNERRARVNERNTKAGGHIIWIQWW
jgi:hypothetical protein